MGTPNSGTPGAHYFSEQPAVPSARRVVRLTLPDVQLDLITDRGVFSAEAVDAGTKLLLAEAPPPPAGRCSLLDLGCGYGPIAITLALRSGGATVWAADVNERALALTVENAAAAGVGGQVRPVRALADVPAGVSFDGIYANPPIRIGKPALQHLLSTWLPQLAPGSGRAWLVVHKHLGADSLASWLEQSGYTVARLVSRMGYRVLEVAAA